VAGFTAASRLVPFDVVGGGCLLPSSFFVLVLYLLASDAFSPTAESYAWRSSLIGLLGFLIVAGV